MPRKHSIPVFLHGRVEPDAYERWLARKARAHVKRDRKRSSSTISVSLYKEAIHWAVLLSKGLDAYTGEELHWQLISTYKNEDAKAGRSSYKAAFALLPAVDHVGAGPTDATFRICGWRTNDAKNDLTHGGFIDLCASVLKHAGYSVRKKDGRRQEVSALKRGSNARLGRMTRKMHILGDIRLLRAAGFDGFMSAGRLLQTKLSGVPKGPGVYLVLSLSKSLPEFLRVNPAFRFRGRDPTLPVAELRSRWIARTPVVYIGKAGTKGGTSTLYSRLRNYLRSGAGHASSHWGGRAIWQIKHASRLRFAWKTASASRARAVERELIRRFENHFGHLPFGNRVR